VKRIEPRKVEEPEAEKGKFIEVSRYQDEAPSEKVKVAPKEVKQAVKKEKVKEKVKSLPTEDIFKFDAYQPITPQIGPDEEYPEGTNQTPRGRGLGRRFDGVRRSNRGPGRLGGRFEEKDFPTLTGQHAT